VAPIHRRWNIMGRSLRELLDQVSDEDIEGLSSPKKELIRWLKYNIPRGE
jgi:hypothetical protein